MSCLTYVIAFKEFDLGSDFSEELNQIKMMKLYLKPLFDDLYST